MNKRILMHLIDVPTNVCKGFVILGTLVLCLKKLNYQSNCAILLL